MESAGSKGDLYASLGASKPRAIQVLQGTTNYVPPEGKFPSGSCPMSGAEPTFPFLDKSCDCAIPDANEQSKSGPWFDRDHGIPFRWAWNR